MKKKTIGIIVGIIGIFALASIDTSDTKIKSIELSIPNYQTEYDINTNIPIEVTVLPENAETDSLEYIVDGDTILFSDAGIITGFEEGIYEIYITSGDIKSNTLSINVIDFTAREEALPKVEKEHPAEELVSIDVGEKELSEEPNDSENKMLVEDQYVNSSKEKPLAEESDINNSEKQTTKEVDKLELSEEPEVPNTTPTEQIVEEA